MKVEGLGDERREQLRQIRSLIEETDEFSTAHFSRMLKNFEREDKTMHQVLFNAQEVAEKNYTRYLNGRLVGSRMALAFLRPENVEGEETVLGKVMGELRENLKSEKEFRRQFLGPEIGRQETFHEIELRKAQKAEIKRQREETRAVTRSQRKGFRPFGFGF